MTPALAVRIPQWEQASLRRLPKTKPPDVIQGPSFLALLEQTKRRSGPSATLFVINSITLQVAKELHR